MTSTGDSDFQSQRLDFVRAVAKTVGKQALASRMKLSLSGLDQVLNGGVYLSYDDGENAYAALSIYTTQEKLDREGAVS